MLKQCLTRGRHILKTGYAKQSAGVECRKGEKNKSVERDQREERLGEAGRELGDRTSGEAIESADLRPAPDLANAAAAWRVWTIWNSVSRLG